MLTAWAYRGRHEGVVSTARGDAELYIYRPNGCGLGKPLKARQLPLTEKLVW